MNYIDAAAASSFGKAILPDRNPTEVYESSSDSFYTVGSTSSGYAAQRKPGKGSKVNEEWIPLQRADINLAIEAWKAVQEGRDIDIKHPWKLAVEASPVKKAYRSGKKDRPMLRDEHGNTWHEYNPGSISRVIGVFKEYDGWMPMMSDHRYAEYDFTSSDSALHRKPLTPEEIEQKRLIDQKLEEEEHRQHMEARKKRHETIQRNHETISRAPQKIVANPNKIKNPDAPPVFVPPEVVAQAGIFCQALASSLQFVDGEDKKEIIDIIKGLAKNFSWHLREDRRKYQ